MTLAYDLFSGDGKVRALLRTKKWPDFPPGVPDEWPAPIRTAVGLMLDSTLPMYVAWGPELHFLYNDAYAELLGAKHPTALTGSFWEVWPEVAQDVRPVIDRALAGYPTFSENVEFHLLRHGHPEQTWFTFSTSPIRNEDGTVAGIFTTCTETTGQALSERRRVADIERLRHLFEQAPGFMAVYRGPDHVFELVNNAYLQLVGHRSIIGKPVSEAVPEIEGQGYFELLDRLYATGEPFVGKGLPVKLQREPNSEPVERFIDFVMQPIIETDGKISGIFVEGSDITEQHHAQLELAAKIQRLEEAERRQAFQLELADRLRTLSAPDDIIATASALLSRHIDVARVLYADVDDIHGTFFIRRDWTRHGLASLAGKVKRLDDFGPEIIAALRSGSIVPIDDITLDRRTADHADAYAQAGIRSHLSIPLVKSGRLIAILSLHQAAPYRWTETDIQLAQDMAERTWSAVESGRAQADLRAERDQSQHIFDSMTEGFAMLDRDWKVRRVNAAGLRTALRTADEAIGRNHWDVWPELAGTEVEALYQRVKQTGLAGIIEYRYARPNSDKAWLEIRAYPALDDGLAVFYRDITQRKNAEENWKETASRLRFTMDSAEIGDWDLDLVNDKANRSLRHDQCFGYTEPIADWSFEKFIQHVHAGDREYVSRQFQRALAELKDWHFECRVVWPDESVHWIAVHGSIYHVDTRPTRMSGIVFDITERKLAEEELRKADQRKDEFLAMLAHELRNPLAPIGAAADLLSISSLDEARVKQISEIISRQVGHMTSLIDDLLDVSRVTRGLVSLDRAPVDIGQIVSDAVEQIRPLIDARSHHLTTQLAPQPAFVSGDRKRLVQVLANLLGNAARYTPEGGRIVVRVEVEAHHVILAVTDNGIGMAPELVARAFEIFSQAERPSDRSQGGLGLGLALVKSLVELHHGSIIGQSDGPGEGSEFRVCLPRIEPLNESLAKSDQHSEKILSKALRLMVVDDNADAAHMLATVLEAAGHEVMVEHDSKKALERARIHVPHVCLLDIGLPDMDGIQLATRLRSQPETASSILIAVTGYGQEKDRENTAAASFDHHFVKPVDTVKLAALLAELSNACPRPAHDISGID